MQKIVTAFALLCLVLPAAADVQIQIRDLTGGSSTISSNGELVRIDAERGNYVLIDYRNGEVLMIDQGRGQVMKSSLGKGGVAVTGAGGVKIGVKSAGGGPKIAGYATKKYSFSANGQNCGTIYASSQLLRDPGVRSMFESMRTMQQKSRQMMGGLGGLMRPCDQANLQLAEVMESIGAPMKMLDEQGKLISEVLVVDTNKRLAKDFYSAPGNLQVVDVDQQLEGTRQQAQEIMQNLPDMNQLIQQLQQGGAGMSEEMQQEMQQQMQQQMEQMQKMLQQLQKQQQQQQQ